MPVPQERLQHCQSSFYQQARCLFHKRGCSIVNHPFINRQDACSTRDEFYCETGILPVKREWCNISVPTDNANPELRHLFQRRQVRQLAADIPTAESQISQTILNSADCEQKLSPSEF